MFRKTAWLMRLNFTSFIIILLGKCLAPKQTIGCLKKKSLSFLGPTDESVDRKSTKTLFPTLRSARIKINGVWRRWGTPSRLEVINTFKNCPNLLQNTEPLIFISLKGVNYSIKRFQLDGELFMLTKCIPILSTDQPERLAWSSDHRVCCLDRKGFIPDRDGITRARVHLIRRFWKHSVDVRSPSCFWAGVQQADLR